MLKIVIINSNFVSSEIKYTATKNHKTTHRSNQKQTRDVLVKILAVATRRIARNFSRG